MTEKTLVIVKPDGVRRNLTGEIIARYEKAGLKLVALKMLMIDEDLIKKHYPDNDEYLTILGKKSEKAGTPVKDYKEQGTMIVSGLRKYMTSGPVVAMILEGDDAIQLVRKVTGYTDPSTADKGTIRGDLGEDSIEVANNETRPVKNLVHASGNSEEAKSEIKLWFPELE